MYIYVYICIVIVCTSIWRKINLARVWVKLVTTGELGWFDPENLTYTILYCTILYYISLFYIILCYIINLILYNIKLF